MTDNESLGKSLGNSLGKLIVLSGPSGVGKGTICKELLAKHPDWQWSISTTSRAPRGDDRPNVDYYFVTKETFEAKIAAHDFLEWAQYGENYYGTERVPIDAALHQNHTILMEIDVQGAEQIKTAFPEAILIFIAPPSLTELEGRLRNRGTNAEEDIQRRLNRAQAELDQMDTFHFTVVNHTIPQSVEQISRILTS